MFNRPIILLLLLWIAGIILAFNFLPPPLPFVALAFLFLLPFFFIKHALAKTFLIFAFFPLSVAWNSAYFSLYASLPSCKGKGFATGKVLEEISLSEDGRASFLLQGEMIRTKEGKDQGKIVKVFLLEGEKMNFRVGQSVELWGEITVPPLKTRLKGIFYYLRSAKLVRVEEGRGFIALIGKLRYSLQETSKRLLPLDSSLILTNLVIGKAGFPAPPHIVEIFRKTGTIHILVVSGTQVYLLLALLWFLLKVVKLHARGSSIAILFVSKEVRKKMGLKPREEVLFLLRGVLFLFFFSLVIIGYTYLVGSEPPIRRAGVMGLLGTVAVILGREMDTFNAFALTALLLLLGYPPVLYSISFQLSFIAVWGLIAILPIARALLPPPRSSFLRFLYLPFITSLAAQLAVSPLLIYHFKMLSPVALIANVFAVPLSFLILIGGLCLLPLALAVPSLEHIIALLLNIPILLLLKVVYFFSKLPLASLQITLPPFIVCFYLFLLFLAGEVIVTPLILKRNCLFFPFLFSLWCWCGIMFSKILEKGGSRNVLCGGKGRLL